MAELEERKKNDGKKTRVWIFDFDETITGPTKRLRRIAKALKKLGDTIIIVTGNTSPRDQLVDRLKNDYKFPFDDLIQYDDAETFGLRRADILTQLNAWGAFDDRASRSPTLSKVCPHFFVSAKPPKDAKDNAKGGKGYAKQRVNKQAKRALLVDGPLHGQTVEHRGLSDLLQIDEHTYRLDGDQAHYVDG